MDPISYPSVTLDGVALALKVTLASLRRLREAGVDGLAPPPDAADIAASCRYIAIYVAACSFLTGPDGKLRHSGLTVEQAEELIEPRDIPKIREALEEALVKATAAETSPVQPPVN